jgi:DNA-binding winged helix-turn-helix (wHTH) protein/Tol biopolymer transport system component
MGSPGTHPDLIRFGPFALDPTNRELRKRGHLIRLRPQALAALLLLTERAGQIVSREEIHQHIWGNDTFVDFERGINFSINQIRAALGDDADKPRFVETIPRRGYRFIADIERSLAEEMPLPPVETAPPAKSGRWGTRLYFRLAMLGAVIIALGAPAVWKTASRTSATPRVVRFTKLTNDGQRKIGPLVSDGVRVYFEEWLPDGPSTIAQVSIKGGEVIPLSVPLKGPFLLDLSKDGTELLMATNDGPGGSSIWVQPVAGGSPHRVGTVLTQYAEFASDGIVPDAGFGADDTSVVYNQGNAVYTVNRDGSSPRKLFAVENVAYHLRFSPDARLLRFSEYDPITDEMTVMGASVDGTGLHKLFQGCCGDWTPDGRSFIFLRRSNDRLDLWALPEATKFNWQKWDDKPTQLTAGPVDLKYPLPSKDGKEIFAVGVSPHVEVIRYDSHTHEFVPYLSGISAEGLAFSHDGKWMAYTSYPDGILWRSRVDGSERLRLTLPPMRASMPRWSPDGMQIAFNATLPGAPWNIYVISSTGGSAERVLPSDQSQADVGWSPDGKSLVFGSAEEPSRAIYILDISSRRISTLPGSRGFFSPHWSPDGRYISGTVIATQELMLFDVSTKEWTKVCDGDVGYPMWSDGGKYLYFEHFPKGQFLNYDIVRLRMIDRMIENIAGLENVGRLPTGTAGAWFGLAPDDSPLIARDISSQEIYALEMEWP